VTVRGGVYIQSFVITK